MKKNLFFAICAMASIFVACDNNNEPEVVNPNEVTPTKVGFSVGENKRVLFSKGNLQYDRVNHKWSFAKKQYECLKEKNLASIYNICNVHQSESERHSGIYGKQLANIIDIFWYSNNSDEDCRWGVPSSRSATHATEGKFVDWGINKIGDDDPNTWRTLTYNEWRYLIFKRKNASVLYAAAQVAGVNGLILFPDEWKAPEEITIYYGMAIWDGVQYFAEHNNFSESQWLALENAGAIFLPTSNLIYYRYCEDTWFFDNHTSWDWRESYYYEYLPLEYGSYHLTNGDKILFYADDLGYSTKTNSAHVRLVKDVKEE